jgi:hypothetical protein
MNALEQLERLVLGAERTVRSREINSKLSGVARALRDADQRRRKAQQSLLEVKDRRGPQIERARADEQRLRELSQKAARLMTHLDQQQVETLLVQAKQELERLLAEASREMAAAQEEDQLALEELKSATAAYQELRAEYERLLPPEELELDGDDVLKRAEELFPSGRLRALEREVMASPQRFAPLPQNEQYYQMMAWIGRVRKLQQEELAEEEMRRARTLYGELVGLSRAHQPGYIEAFRQDFHTDWDAYIAEADRCLRQLVEARQQEEQRRKRAEEPQDSLFESDVEFARL